LPAPERRLTIDALWQLVLVGVRLRVRRRERFLDLLEVEPRKPHCAMTDRRMAQIVHHVTDALPWKVNCLERSLVLARVLRRCGKSPALRLGVRQTEDSYLFHAWLEVDGLVVNDTVDIATIYAPFAGTAVPDWGEFG